ncbi:MAG: hypothetical protein ACYC9O_20900, partial [Candidatus Latescibacterota bacterium]
MSTRIWYFLIILSCTLPSLAFPGWNIKEKDRQALNVKMDRQKLRQKTDFVTDRSAKMLVQPKTEKVA